MMMAMVAAEYDPDNKYATPSVPDWYFGSQIELINS